MTISILDYRERVSSTTALTDVVPRASFRMAEAVPQAEALIADVRERGSAALLDQAERFDGIRPATIRVGQAELQAALAELDPALREAIEESIIRVRAASANQVPESTTTTFAGGASIVQRWQPVNRAGLYIPGGKAVYPSSVVMNVVAAQAAGVGSIALASPAQREFQGLPHPTILATAALLGVDEVYAMGGAGAIGALAYGVPELELLPVSVITGPGNIFVAAAKRLVSSVVGIDAEAGPTEIVIIADAEANPALVAADLLSQAEHDELAAAVLITDSMLLLERVEFELSQQLAKTPNRERASAALRGKQSALIVVDNLRVAAELSNAYAPEHLSLMVRDPESLLPLLRDAGAIFVGEYSPVSLGDYLAGSNHVLPTGGQAHYRSGLSAATFLRPQQIVHYTEQSFQEVAAPTEHFARAEHLFAHADAITLRSSGLN